MHKRFVLAIIIVCLAVGVLIWSAVSNTAKAVVTVEELESHAQARTNIRLGARVTEDRIDYRTQPDFQLNFFVHGISSADPAKKIPVVYKGIMPDTLQAGRDVILEGDYSGGQFIAKHLLTQCPSKYEPPVPGALEGASTKSY